ncbi:hypothetical protein CDAR_228151 [Caerostris darwini]|uniref:Uncharacterized protein n=1 Tax=Caerostris darwini TaxID=1538125 RepID=A0AAV4N4Y2_9ARAC|nr:hypothetical protein CDAR_228151 [Caerostris darwini]
MHHVKKTSLTVTKQLLFYIIQISTIYDLCYLDLNFSSFYADNFIITSALHRPFFSIVTHLQAHHLPQYSKVLNPTSTQCLIATPLFTSRNFNK